MPMRPTSVTARLLREAHPVRAQSGAELADQARLRDPSWPLPSTGGISSAANALSRAGYLHTTTIRQTGSDPSYWRLTPAGVAERARLFPEAAVAV